MKETCVNVFAYGDEELVYTIGYLTYLAEGSYEDLNRLLMSKVDSDYRRAPRITLDSPMTWRDFPIQLPARLAEWTGKWLSCHT